MHWTPYHYVEVLVDFYYRKAMRALRYQYQFQQENINNPCKCVGWYNNYDEFLSDSFQYPNPLVSVFSARHNDAVRWFLGSFGLGSYDKEKIEEQIDNSLYVLEVDDIIKNADKSKKVNALVGPSPHII